MGTHEHEDTRAGFVYGQIRGSLLSGGMSAGQRITTRGLAEVMGVSATPVREALGRLVAEGALELGAHKTVQVPVLTAEQVDEVYDARLLLEGLLIEAAVPRRTDAQLAHLREILAVHATSLSTGDQRTSIAKNFEFKFTIYERAQLSTVFRIVESLWLRTGPHIHLVYDPSMPGPFVEIHRDALAALEAGDAIRLKWAIRRDLMEAQARIRAAVQARFGETHVAATQARLRRAQNGKRPCPSTSTAAVCRPLRFGPRRTCPCTLTSRAPRTRTRRFASLSRPPRRFRTAP